jgi:KDO2-lipid IV(A) lauroyltransferase
MNVNGILRRIILKSSEFVCTLPKQSSKIIAGSMGLLASKLWLTERKRLKDTIGRVYFRLGKDLPDNLDHIIEQMFIHFSINIAEILRYPKVTAESLKQTVEFKGLNHLEDALAQKKGVILALPHIGNWEILGAAIAHLGYPLHSFFLAQKEDELGGLLDHFRSYSKIILHDRDRGGIKALKALRKGEILGMIADQDGANQGVYMDFLGHWVSMPAGPANWSLKTGALVVPLFSLRKGKSSKFIAELLPALPPEEGNTHKEKVINRTKRLALWMEELILQNPQQYLWFYDRFKPRHEDYILKQKQDSMKMIHGEYWYGG